MHPEPQHDVLLCFLTKLVIPLDNNKMVAKLLHQVTDVSRFEVTWFPVINAEHLQGILDNTIQVDGGVVAP